jgi:type II secretory pathway predicted ATPase ExeA
MMDATDPRAVDGGKDAGADKAPLPSVPGPAGSGGDAAQGQAVAKPARKARSGAVLAAAKPVRGGVTAAAKSAKEGKVSRTVKAAKPGTAAKVARPTKSTEPANAPSGVNKPKSPARRSTATMAMAASIPMTRAGGDGAEPAVPTCLYQSFFGLQREPFSIAPDPRAMFMSERHREALAHLLYGVQGGSGGFVLLTGEIGAGKTTVSRCLLEQMPSHVRVAWILNPRQNADEMLASICEEFGIKVADLEPKAAAAAEPGVLPSAPEGPASSTQGAEPQGDVVASPPLEDPNGRPLGSAAAAGGETIFPAHAIEFTHGAAWPDRVEPPLRRSTKRYVDALRRFLLLNHSRGRHCVLIIDEAQSLGADVLEQLRLLTNLETHERKLLQIVLIGQPELRRLLAGPGMEQLSQRVIARYHLSPLSEDETVRYIRHRMEFAGLGGVVPFDADAHKRIYRLTRGVPRQVNRVCDRALLGAYSARVSVIDAATVQKAWDEVNGADTVSSDAASAPRLLQGRWPLSGRSGIAVAVVGLLVAALLGWWLVRGEGRTASAGPQGSAPQTASALVYGSSMAGAGERAPR